MSCEWNRNDPTTPKLPNTSSLPGCRWEISPKYDALSVHTSSAHWVGRPSAITNLLIRRIRSGVLTDHLHKWTSTLYRLLCFGLSLLSQALGIVRERSAWLSVRIMWLSVISGNAAGSLVSQWGNTIKSPTVHTVTSRYRSWYDFRGYQ